MLLIHTRMCKRQMILGLPIRNSSMLIEDVPISCSVAFGSICWFGFLILAGWALAIVTHFHHDARHIFVSFKDMFYFVFYLFILILLFLFLMFL